MVLDSSKGSIYRLLRGAMANWVLLGVVVGIVLRITLLLHPITSPLTIAQIAAAMALGVVNDACIMVLDAVPAYLFMLSSGHSRLRRPWCYVCLGLLACLWTWITFSVTSLHEFNAPLARILSWVVVYWFASFAIRTFVPQCRKWLMRVSTAAIVFVYLFVFILNACGEWFFWNEFGVRYNFIAVDYLVYTSEVVGNIMQSYSMGWIITGVTVMTVLLELALFRRLVSQSCTLCAKGWRPKATAVYLALCAVSVGVIPLAHMAQHTGSPTYNNLQANGVDSFVRAFMANSLDYREFYIVVPDEVAAREFGSTAIMPADSVKQVPVTPNIVLITIESMSGDYLARFGNTDTLTATLDALYGKSLAFDRMFAAGNRTVRGLEALTMSRPPSPGESIVKRHDDSKQYPSIADKLTEMGYTKMFFYGGDSYFDNMEEYFTKLDFKIYDRKSMDVDTIECQTVWGVSDNEVYERLIATLDSATATGNQVFALLLTTSNHRPYIFPEGKGRSASRQNTRKGAVMYSDYALGEFLTDASKHSWFDNTVFVIVADHCASSAGSTELPLENYHIPALIYAPALVQARVIDYTTSQIDLMPTLFGLLGWQPDNRLYGRDALSAEFKPRAYMATYQDLGYFEGDTLTVLSPSRVCRQFKLTHTPDNQYATTRVDVDAASLMRRRAAALYQSAN